MRCIAAGSMGSPEMAVREAMRPCAVIIAAVAVLLSTNVGLAELVLVSAQEMSGIEAWKEGQSWGAGSFYISNGTPLTKSVDFEGGEYAVYARIFTSAATEADMHILVNGKRLVPLDDRSRRASGCAPDGPGTAGRDLGG